MKVEFFEGSCGLTATQRSYGIRTIEERIQEFLDENSDITIHHIKQSSSSSGDSEDFNAVTTISIWYS